MNETLSWSSTETPPRESGHYLVAVMVTPQQGNQKVVVDSLFYSTDLESWGVPKTSFDDLYAAHRPCYWAKVAGPGFDSCLKVAKLHKFDAIRERLAVYYKCFHEKTGASTLEEVLKELWRHVGDYMMSNTQQEKREKAFCGALLNLLKLAIIEGFHLTHVSSSRYKGESAAQCVVYAHSCVSDHREETIAAAVTTLIGAARLAGINVENCWSNYFSQTQLN